MQVLATVPISTWIVAPNSGQVAIGRPLPGVDATKGQELRCTTVTINVFPPRFLSFVVIAVVHGWFTAPPTSKSRSTTGEETSL